MVIFHSHVSLPEGNLNKPLTTSKLDEILMTPPPMRSKEHHMIVRFCWLRHSLRSKTSIWHFCRVIAMLVDHYCPHRTFCLPGTHRGCLNIMWSHDNETLHSLYNNHTQYPRVICYIAIENGHRNSGFTHWKWWCSIVFCMFTRGYHSSGSLIWKLGPSANDSPYIHHLQTGMSRRHDVKVL